MVTFSKIGSHLVENRTINTIATTQTQTQTQTHTSMLNPAAFPFTPPASTFPFAARSDSQPEQPLGISLYRRTSDGTSYTFRHSDQKYQVCLSTHVLHHFKRDILFLLKSLPHNSCLLGLTHISEKSELLDTEFITTESYHDSELLNSALRRGLQEEFGLSPNRGCQRFERSNVFLVPIDSVTPLSRTQPKRQYAEPYEDKKIGMCIYGSPKECQETINNIHHFQTCRDNAQVLAIIPVATIIEALESDHRLIERCVPAKNFYPPLLVQCKKGWELVPQPKPPAQPKRHR